MTKAELILHCVPEFADRTIPFTKEHYFALCGAQCAEVKVEGNWSMVVGADPVLFLEEYPTPKNKHAKLLYEMYDLVSCPKCRAHPDLPLLALGAV